MPRISMVFTCLALPSAALAQAEMSAPGGFAVEAFEAGEDTLSCYVGGEGPTLVLLHGWPQTADEWRPVLPLLAEDHRVLACDLPGIRASTNSAGDFTKAAMAETILTALGEQAPFHLVGHDIGLMVAYAMAHADADAIRSLTLMDAPIPGTPAYEQIAKDPRAWHFAFHQAPEVPERIVGNDVDYYIGHFISSLWMAQGGPPEEVIAAAAEAYSDPDTLRAGFEFYRAFPDDAEHNAGLFETPLPMPVLALSSGLTPQPYVLRMMEPLSENVQGGAIAAAGHWLPEEAPDEITGRIANFVAEVEGS